MRDLLNEMVAMAGEHPEIAMGVAAALLVLLLAWGVVSSSYRYR